jgi:hypothetical protein
MPHLPQEPHDLLRRVVEPADVPDHAYGVEQSGHDGRDVPGDSPGQLLAGLLQARQELEIVLRGNRLPLDQCGQVQVRPQVAALGLLEDAHDGENALQRTGFKGLRIGRSFRSRKKLERAAKQTVGKSESVSNLRGNAHIGQTAVRQSGIGGFPISSEEPQENGLRRGGSEI